MTTPKPKPMSERDRVRIAYAAHCKKYGKPAPKKWSKIRVEKRP